MNSIFKNFISYIIPSAYRCSPSKRMKVARIWEEAPRSPQWKLGSLIGSHREGEGNIRDSMYEWQVLPGRSRMNRCFFQKRGRAQALPLDSDS